MNILVVGETVNFNECLAKFGASHTYILENNPMHVGTALSKSDVVFDFMIKDDPTRLNVYIESASKIFVDTTEISLSQLLSNVDKKTETVLFGFCGMPTLFNRPHLEISLFQKAGEDKLKAICKELNTDFLLVEDKTGLVTPRVISMIINEAYFTVEDGIASREDIDSAMKLGTNYPFGPFEWSKKIGLKKVYRLLEAVYEETNDERYKVCLLLKTESQIEPTPR
jgi:3-hydroxybutyryl-CoA dehydrogenase